MEVAAASSELHSDGCFEGGTTGDFFAVEDLLDFSGDQLGEEEGEEMGHDEAVKGPAPNSDVSSSSTATVADAACDAVNLDGAGGLCPVPYAEQELKAELEWLSGYPEVEWLSGHLEEDEPVLPTEDIQKLKLISGSGATNTPSSYGSPSSSSSTITSVMSCSSSSYSTSSNDSTLHQQLLPIHDEDSVLMAADHSNNSIDAVSAVLPQSPPLRGARSKRSRADPGTWATRLAALLTSKAAAADSPSSDQLAVPYADYTCSSTSSYAATGIVPFIPAEKQRKKSQKPLKPHKTILKPHTSGFHGEDEPAAANVHRCFHCDTDKTPQWRTGPMGPKTLCNACGVRYKSGRLVPEYRPAASPTFVMSKHSNSHRKVMELRRQKESHNIGTTMRHHQADDDEGAAGTGAFSPFLHPNFGLASSAAHMFPLCAVDGMHVEAAVAPPNDFLILHHTMGSDFRQFI